MGVLAAVLLSMESRIPVIDVSASPTALAVENTTPMPALIDTEPTTTSTLLPDNRLAPADWRDWSVIPRISQHALEVYRAGIEHGNDPKQFTILGDCHSMPDVMFAPFDDPAFVLPPEYADLESAHVNFAGEFARQPITVQNGMDEASLFSVNWNDITRCNFDETPLECELRIHNPTIAIISLGTNWGTGDVERYEAYMRRILDGLLEQGILPVITTMADKEAGDDFPLNRIMAELSYEYDLPLWNFWRLAQALPNGGLVEDPAENYHLTTAAWEARRYSGLAVLDAILQAAQ
jgi:hypothetical protein